MFLLYTSTIVFNVIAYKFVKGMSANKVVHIWLFTISLQLLYDTFIDLKYHGYWYLTQGIDYLAFPAYTLLIPPINVLFLEYFPFGRSMKGKTLYIIIWTILLLLYEMLVNLPPPWGYFHYGWWKFWYSCFMDPILLLILIGFYKFITKLENKLKLGH